MYFWILVLGILAELVIGQPVRWLRLRYGLAWALRAVHGWQMRHPAKNPKKRALLTCVCAVLTAMLVAAALCLPLPWLGVLCIYLAMDLRTIVDRAMRVRGALDDGRLLEARASLTQLTTATGIEEYDDIVRAAVSGLAIGFARAVLAMLLLMLIGAPLGLAPSMAFGYAMLVQLSRTENQYAKAVQKRIDQCVLPVASFCFAALCGLLRMRTGKAMEAFRRQRRNPGIVMQSALGLAGGDEHPAMSGDITQACVLCFLVVIVLLLIAMLGFGIFGWL